MPEPGSRQGFAKRSHVKPERLRHSGSAVFRIELLVFVERTNGIPCGAHSPVIPADEIARAGDDSCPEALVVAVHLGVPILAREPVRSAVKFRGAHEIRGAADEVRILAGDPERHEAAHGQPRGRAMVAIGDRAKRGIDVSDQLRKVQRKLAVGFNRADVVRPRIILARSARIVAIPSDDNDVVRADEARDVVSAVLIPGVVASSTARRLVVSLAPAVKEINDRISPFGCLVVGRRQENAEFALFAQDATVVREVHDARRRLCPRTTGRDD